MAEKSKKSNGLHRKLGGLSGKAGKALEGRNAQLRRQEEMAMGGKRTGESRNDNSGGRKGRK